MKMNQFESPEERAQFWAAYERDRRRWKNANIAVGSVGAMGCFFWISALFLTMPLFLVVALLNAVLGFVSGHVRLFRKRKTFLYILRTIAIITAIVFVLPPLFVMGFAHTPLFYPAKCFAFLHGVQSSDEIRRLLPEHLPDVCSDYCFITQGCAIAQDYHPSCYLMLHTDEETLSRLEEQYAGWLLRNDPPVWDEENPAPDPNMYTEENWLKAQCPALSSLAAVRLWDSGFRDDLSEAVVYGKGAAPPVKGALINHQTGLFMIWT